MIKLAVCDDNREMCEFISKQAETYMHSQNDSFTIQSFYGGQELLYEIEDGAIYDIVLLDIEMSGLDGIKLTEFIKAYLPDILIIFITDHEKYVYESFKVQPFRFIPKNFMEQMLTGALKDAILYINKFWNKYYFAQNQAGMEKIPTRSITYIWHKEKYAYIEKINGESTKVRKTLKQVYGELPAEDFIWIDRGCICNLMHISRISEGDILLIDGTRLQVSKDRLSNVKKTLSNYWIEKDDI